MKQLSVYVENEIGSLAKVTSVLKNADISVKAVSVFDSPDFSIMRCVVDQEEKAKSVLAENHFAARITDVVAVNLEDRTGELDALLRIFQEEEISIRYMYSFVYRGIDNPLLVLSTDKFEASIEALQKNGVTMIDSL